MRAHLANPSYGLTWRAALQLGSEGSMSPRRNKIINGDMRIDQANAGAAVTVNTTGVASATVDKWRALGTSAAGVFTVQRQTAGAPVGSTHFVRLTVTTADAAPAAASVYDFYQFIEGIYIPDLKFGQAVSGYVTLSFKVRSSLTGTFSGSLRNGPNNRGLVFSFPIVAANTWEQKTLVLPIDLAGTWPTDNSAGLILTFDLGSGTNLKTAETGAWVAAGFVGVSGSTGILATNGATLDFAEVMIEAGTLKSEFERVPINQELQLCQREFFKTFIQSTAPAQNVGLNTGCLVGVSGKAGVALNFLWQAFPVVMRTTPIITGFNPAAANSNPRDVSAAADCSFVSMNQISEREFCANINGNAATVAGNQIVWHVIADARF